MAILRRRVLLVAVLIVASIGVTLAQVEKVYVTKTGAKYHRESCSSLRASRIEMPLAEAAARFGACKNCRPPVPSAPAASAVPATASAAPAAPRAAAATASRCQATTKKGTQCSRNAQAGRNYCWQH